ncbi:BRO-N domain-containing protein [Moraxella porci]|uniref:BRO-N domain-containing protein n=1 Tax=Moraxella porci TaxID=1288392 RepID=UPI0024472F5E|nr:BRO family protein [Moraxella porci]MDH2272997.1 BRO family protein [Moraxella porci]
MQTQISIFNFESTKQVRTAVHEDGGIWFCLPDVARVLEISNANPSRFNLSEAGVHKMYISYDSGKKQVTFVNEPNLYRVIFRSNKDEAVKFQNWVFDEVLPTIRKTGGYTARTTTDDRTPLRQAVSLLVSRRGLDYSTAYTLVHQYMGVSHIDEIALADLPKAIDYVHSLIIKPVATQDEFGIVCHQTVNKVMDYLHSLHAEIRRLGGTSPKLDVDEGALAKAVMTRMVQGKRMMVSIDHWSKPVISLVDDQSWIIHSDNIAKLIADPDGLPKETLPSIIQAALQRSGLTV